MPTVEEIKRLPLSERLDLMDVLWASFEQQDLPSPPWHLEILDERDRLIESGEDFFVDWEQAKQEIREGIE